MAKPSPLGCHSEKADTEPPAPKKAAEEEVLASVEGLTLEGEDPAVPAADATEGKFDGKIQQGRQARREQFQQREVLNSDARKLAKEAAAAQRAAKTARAGVLPELNEAGEVFRLLTLGGVRFVYVFNIVTGLDGDPGYLIAVNGPTGSALNDQQQLQYAAAVGMAGQLPGFQAAMWPFWWPTACLNNPQVQETLENSGFAKFTNFSYSADAGQALADAQLEDAREELSQAKRAADQRKKEQQRRARERKRLAAEQAAPPPRPR